MAKAKKKAVPVKRPRQQRLPGVEDAKLEALEDAAMDYVHVRDKRIAIQADEIPLKQKLIAMMKADKRTKYRRDGFEIDLVLEKENIKVRVTKDKGDD